LKLLDAADTDVDGDEVVEEVLEHRDVDVDVDVDVVSGSENDRSRLPAPAPAPAPALARVTIAVAEAAPVTVAVDLAARSRECVIAAQAQHTKRATKKTLADMGRCRIAL